VTGPGAPGDAFRAFVLILAAVGLLRLAELIWSAANLRRRGRAARPEPLVFPGLVALHVAVVLLPPLEVLALGRPFSRLPGAAAGAALLAGLALRAWTLRTLGRSWSVRVVPPDAGRLVTHGPYRYIRHPNYLALILEVASLPLLHGAWICSLGLSALNAWLLAGRIRAEEAVLSEQPAWRATMAGRARLVPGLF
jgi:methyltransferase